MSEISGFDVHRLVSVHGLACKSLSDVVYSI